MKIGNNSPMLPICSIIINRLKTVHVMSVCGAELTITFKDTETKFFEVENE